MRLLAWFVLGVLGGGSLPRAGAAPARPGPARVPSARRARSVAPQPALKLKATVFAPGAVIRVGFTARTSWARDAWVGILPARIPHGSEAVNDQHDVTYQYLAGRGQGVLTFRAPHVPGRWDLRLHDTDANGREMAYVTFDVVAPGPRPAPRPAPAPAPAPTAGGGGTLKLKQTTYAPGQAITVQFQAPATWHWSAWVGVIPAAIPHGSEAVNDQHDLEYRYLRQRSQGRLSFTAPAAPGRYDLRLHDTDANGRETTYVSFEVK